MYWFVCNQYLLRHVNHDNEMSGDANESNARYEKSTKIVKSSAVCYMYTEGSKKNNDYIVYNTRKSMFTTSDGSPATNWR